MRSFYRLCCLEETDREKWVIDAIWGDSSSSMRELTEAALVDSQYRIHPDIAEVGREQSGPELPEAHELCIASDRILWTLIAAIEREAGPDGYLLVASADHGVAPTPEEEASLFSTRLARTVPRNICKLFELRGCQAYFRRLIELGSLCENLIFLLGTWTSLGPGGRPGGRNTAAGTTGSECYHHLIPSERNYLPLQSRVTQHRHDYHRDVLVLVDTRLGLHAGIAGQCNLSKFMERGYYSRRTRRRICRRMGCVFSELISRGGPIINWFRV